MESANGNRTRRLPVQASPVESKWSCFQYGWYSGCSENTATNRRRHSAVTAQSCAEGAGEVAAIRNWYLVTAAQDAIAFVVPNQSAHSNNTFLRVARNSPGVVQRERRFWRTSQSMTTGCCWPLLPVRPPRDGAFFVRSPAGVNGATLQENAPEASCRLVFRCDVSPVFSVPRPS